MKTVSNAKTPTPSPIRRFMLLSITVHLALLTAWHFPVPMSFANPNDNILSVTLSTRTFSSSQLPFAHSEQNDRLSDQIAKSTNTIHQFRSTETEMTASTPAEQSAAVSSGTAGMSADTAPTRVQSRLLTDLARHFQYPLIARQHGWEGTVLLGLRVESDGHLQKLRIERSSGYAVLDHSALNSLSRVGRVAEASGWLNGRGMDMQLPVIYRLIEN
jgi:TonB family protein